MLSYHTIVSYLILLRFNFFRIHSHIKQYEEEAILGKVEGEELKRLAAHYELEMRRLDEARALESEQMMKENLHQIDDVQRMKQINAQQEEVGYHMHIINKCLFKYP